MATGQQWFSNVRQRDAFGAYGLAMPSSLVKQHCITGWARNLNGPVFTFAQGRSVPISRGSPPISG